MQVIEIILIAISLSFDTFTVSISAGLNVKIIRFWQGVRISIILALFQSIMPLLGWWGGIQIVGYISSIDHWIAFGLLSLIGFKMIFDSFKKDENKRLNPLLFGVVLLMGLATSIDALVVGVSLAFVDLNIYYAAIIIGLTTFIAAMIGLFIGKSASGRLGKKVEVLGGLILIGIGIRILIEHIY